MATAPQDWARVTELFTATFEASAEERRRVLDARAGADGALRRRVEALLAAHDAGDGALDQPPLALLDGLDPSLLSPVASLVGRVLGPYRVIREIARGGMGAVYEGVRQDAEFEQRVAIKTLRVGADSEAVLQRFRQERRILAGLQHPNIAALFDGGVTQEGLPYFILELVAGQPIDEFCSSRQLPLAARLDLFRQVVSAVQYAHGQLVIHRDLKPSNILVTAEGVAKLVDFGIAKLLQPDGPDVTADLRAPLTISYASPEQVKGEPISTATDVYSLGGVLYRLLAGRNPLEVDSLSLDRAVSAICEVTPAPPSQVASEECAHSMGLGSAERLRRELGRDLDAIVMMTLRKEPERRYPTAQALGDDLRRFLQGLPVSAAPDTLGYRFGKFARRRRALVVGIGIAAAALVSGAGLALWQERAARHEARRAVESSRFLQGLIGAADLSGLSRAVHLGPGATVAELLDSAARRAPRELSDPEVRASVHLALGRAYLAQERWKESAAQYDSARAIIERQFRNPRIEVARALAGMTELELIRGGPRAESIAARARAEYLALGLTRSEEYARVLGLLGVSRAFAGAWQSADTLLRAALRIEEALGPRPTVLKATTIANLAAVGEYTGAGWQKATADYRRALAMFDSIPGGEFTEKGEVLWYAARLEGSRGNFRAADSLSREALRVYERANGLQSHAVAQQLVQLAEYARVRGDTAAARESIERAMRIIRARPEIIAIVRERVLLEDARYLWRVGRLAAADSVAGEAYRSRVATGNSVYVAEAGQVYGAILRDERRFKESELVLLDAYRRSATTSGGSTVLIAASLVRLYAAWERPAAAAPYLSILPDSLRRDWAERLRKGLPLPKA